MSNSFLNGVQIVWNSSSIKLAEECLQKYKYQALDGWQTTGSSVHLRFGSHYATALEHYYKHRAYGMSSHEALCAVVREALELTWDRTEEGAAPWDSGDPNKTRFSLLRTIVWYVDQFEDEAISVIHHQGVPAVELSFAFPVDNGITFSGHIDRLVDYAGGTYVMDQKTTKATLTSYYFDQYSPDTQMSMYTWAGQAVFASPVKGVIIDAAQIAVGFSRFERGFTFRTKSQLDEWYDHTMFHIELAQNATKANHFPQNRSSCGNYGGCAFRKVCGRSPEVRPQFLAADFIKGKMFDPLEKR